MQLHTWWLFLVTVFVLCGTPGPNMLHVMHRSVHLGLRGALPAMLGCLLALVAVLVASAAGLSTLLLASPRVFELLRYLGVGYLLWLGIKAWRSAPAALDPATPLPVPSAATPRQVFRGALLVGLSNPKLILFAAAFLPQFVDPARGQAPQYALLIATFAGCELCWYLVYGLCGQRLRASLARPALRRLFDRVTGTIFVGFGLLLWRFRPQ